MFTTVSAAACESTSQASANTHTPTSVENLASAGHLPPDVLEVLDDIERRHRERYSFQLVYRIREERDYRTWPSPHEVALRLSGKFPGGIHLHLPFAQHAVTTVQNRPPDKQPSRQGKAHWRQRNGRKGAHVRWAPTSTARSERDDAIIAARAGGQLRTTVAAQHGIDPRHVSRIATPDAVAAWREQQVTLAISSENPDDVFNPMFEKSSLSGNIDSQCHLPSQWLLNSWSAAVAGDVNNSQAVHLVNWGADADADRINAVDLVRLVQWASTADNPWAYVASNVQDLYQLGRDGETLEYLLSAAPERAIRMVQSGYVAKPRAYLATAIRNAKAERKANPAPVDRGGYIKSWLPDGRLPWKTPPAPEPHPAVGSVPAPRHRNASED